MFQYRPCYQHPLSRRVWRYQRDNQNPYIEEEQTTQWPKEKVQKDKQRSIKYTYKTKDLVTRTPLKVGVNSGAPGNRNSDHRLWNIVTHQEMYSPYAGAAWMLLHINGNILLMWAYLTFLGRHPYIGGV